MYISVNYQIKSQNPYRSSMPRWIYKELEFLVLNNNFFLKKDLYHVINSFVCSYPMLSVRDVWFVLYVTCVDHFTVTLRPQNFISWSFHVAGLVHLPSIWKRFPFFNLQQLHWWIKMRIWTWGININHEMEKHEKF